MYFVFARQDGNSNIESITIDLCDLYIDLISYKHIWSSYGEAVID